VEGEGRGALGGAGLPRASMQTTSSPMPTPQVTRSSVGPSVARNAFGNAPRTLGGIFSAPTSYDSFGTLPANTAVFDPGTSVTLSTVNVPGYGLTKGTTVRFSFTGIIDFNGVAGPASGFVRFIVNPNALGVPYDFILGIITPPGGVASYIFGGQVDLLVQGASSDACDVAISSLFFVPGLSPSAPVLSLPLGASVGILSLDTTGLASGIDFSVTASMSPPPAAASIAKIQLNRFVVEMAGG